MCLLRAACGHLFVRLFLLSHYTVLRTMRRILHIKNECEIKVVVEVLYRSVLDTKGGLVSEAEARLTQIRFRSK